MNKRYRLIIFDWEGTLADNISPVLDCIAFEAQKLNLGYFDLEIAKQSIGLGLSKAVKCVFPDIKMTQYESLIRQIHYKIPFKNNRITLIPGARSLIQALHSASIYLAVASNKNIHALEKALDMSQLNHFFAVVRGTGQVAAKPCTQMLTEILDSLHLSAEEALMIGDSRVDIIMANLLNMDALGFDFYHQNKKDLEDAGAIAVVDTYQRVADFLQITYKDSEDRA